MMTTTGFDWDDLNETFTLHPKTKPGHVVRNALKEAITPVAAEPETTFLACLQTQRGKLSAMPEGLLAEAEFVLYCNTTAKKGGLPLTFAEGDVVSLSGKRYRIILADAPKAEDGSIDHYKLYLTTKGKQGEAP